MPADKLNTSTMLIPVPDRFKARPVVLFIALVFLGQQIVRTDIVFSILTSLYICLFALAFNISGGITFPSGAFIFFNGVLTCIFGLTYKILLLEPGEKNLRNGNKAMLCYCGGMLSMLIATAISRRLRPKRALLAGIAAGEGMKRAAIGCLIFGVTAQFLSQHSAEGTIGSAIRQVNHFITAAILLATTYEFYRSNGRKATNWIVYAGVAYTFSLGLIYFGKELLLGGTVTWLSAAIALGYRFNRRQIIGFGLGTFLILYYLVPYSQYVRSFSTASRTENLATAEKYLADLNETRRLYLVQVQSHENEFEPHLYNTPQGFFDRLSMLAYDDAIINYTDQGNVFGLLPTFYSYANIVPHFIWRDKPHVAYGNVYGHEIGVLDQEDETTGISFSPTGDAYHQATWFGVLCVWPLVAFLFFFTTDSLTGSARAAPWALIPIVTSTHAAPEGMLGGIIFMTTYDILGILIVVLSAKYVFPMITALLTGARQSGVQAPDLRLDIGTGGLQPASAASDTHPSA